MSRVTFFSHFTKFTQGDKQADVPAANVRQVIDGLALKYGEGFRSRLLREDGEPKDFVRIFLNGKDIRLVGNLEAATGPDDQLLIVPAVAGG